MNFLFKMLSQECLGEMKSEIFSCEAFLLLAVDEMFIGLHLFQKTSRPENLQVTRLNLVNNVSINNINIQILTMEVYKMTLVLQL